MYSHMHVIVKFTFGRTKVVYGPDDGGCTYYKVEVQ